MQLKSLFLPIFIGLSRSHSTSNRGTARPTPVHGCAAGNLRQCPQIVPADGCDTCTAAWEKGWVHLSRQRALWQSSSAIALNLSTTQQQTRLRASPMFDTKKHWDPGNNEMLHCRTSNIQINRYSTELKSFNWLI